MSSDVLPNILGLLVIIIGWEYYKNLLVEQKKFFMPIFVWLLTCGVGVSLIEMVVK